jgi:quercetin dioxygenase-like cupin family protein
MPWDGCELHVAEITVDGVAHLVTAGEMLELPAGRPHALKAVQRFKMVLVMIRE